MFIFLKDFETLPRFSNHRLSLRPHSLSPCASLSSISSLSSQLLHRLPQPEVAVDLRAPETCHSCRHRKQNKGDKVVRKGQLSQIGDPPSFRVDIKTNLVLRLFEKGSFGLRVGSNSKLLSDWALNQGRLPETPSSFWSGLQHRFNLSRERICRALSTNIHTSVQFLHKTTNSIQPHGTILALTFGVLRKQFSIFCI